MKKINILAIAPYDEMKNQLIDVASDYHNINMTVLTGNLEAGANIAKNTIEDKYDIILSRGGTAELIKEVSHIPVVEIQISAFDILCSLKLSQTILGSNDESKMAIVGYSNITKNAHLLCEVLDYNLDVYTIEDSSMLTTILQYIKEKGYSLVICDMVTNLIAKTFQIDTILISSGRDNIRKAIDDAIKIAKNYTHLAEENELLKNILSKKNSNTLIYDSNHYLYYSTIDRDLDKELIDNILKNEIKNLNETPKRIVKYRNNYLYTITGYQQVTEISCFYIFNLSIKKVNSTQIKNKIYYQSSEDIEKELEYSLLQFSDSFKVLQTYIDLLKKKSVPLIVEGEDGVGKVQAIKTLYLYSKKISSPMITIDCQNVSQNTIEYLLENQTSPLFDKNNTIFFQNIDSLDNEYFDELINHLNVYQVCSRNQVFFSSVSTKESGISAKVEKVVYSLDCLTINLLPLREQKNTIPTLINKYYNKLNSTLDFQIAGVSPKGVHLLQQYEWKYNFIQFKRLLNTMALGTKSPIISYELVEETLKSENNALKVTVNKNVVGESLDLSKTLAEIQVDIVKKVLIDVDNNHTKASERLGISRTTLWRLLK